MKGGENLNAAERNKMQKAFDKIDKCKKAMGEVDSIIETMTQEEFFLYITMVEIPHSSVLSKIKTNYEKEGIDMRS